MNPSVSILIPTLNRATYLKQAVESARAQDYPNLEIVIADNGSTDETADIIQAYLDDPRVRYLRRPDNIGMVNNWRDALYDHCQGDWFVILSDDDYFIDPRYISKAIALACRSASILMVFADGLILDETTGTTSELHLPFPEVVAGKTVFLSRGTIRPQDFTLCNILFKRAAALELKPFSNSLNLTCDTELFLLLALRGDIGVIKTAVSVYRTTGTNNINLVRQDPNLIIHGTDSVISGYLAAKEQPAISRAKLAAWRRRVVDGALHVALKRLHRHAPKRVDELFAHVYSRSPELLWSVSRRYPIKVGLVVLSWRLRRIAINS